MAYGSTSYAGIGYAGAPQASTSNVTVTLTTATMTLAAPTGLVGVGVALTTAPLTVTAPVGAVGLNVPLAAASVTFSAPPGLVGVGVALPTAAVTLAAPVGTVAFAVAVALTTASLTLAAPSGTANPAGTGPTFSVVAAPNGELGSPGAHLGNLLLGAPPVGRSTPRPLRVRFGGLGASRWLFGNAVPPGGKLRQQQSALSCKYVRCRVSATFAGLVYDPTLDSVQMAFIASSANPGGLDWQSAVWQTDSGTGFVWAMCLVGPGGTIALPAGRYSVWVKVTDFPEVPAESVDTLIVT